MIRKNIFSTFNPLHGLKRALNQFYNKGKIVNNLLAPKTIPSGNKFLCSFKLYKVEEANKKAFSNSPCFLYDYAPVDEFRMKKISVFSQRYLLFCFDFDILGVFLKKMYYPPRLKLLLMMVSQFTCFLLNGNKLNVFFSIVLFTSRRID